MPQKSESEHKTPEYLPIPDEYRELVGETEPQTIPVPVQSGGQPPARTFREWLDRESLAIEPMDEFDPAREARSVEIFLDAGGQELDESWQFGDIVRKARRGQTHVRIIEDSRPIRTRDVCGVVFDLEDAMRRTHPNASAADCARFWVSVDVTEYLQSECGISATAPVLRLLAAYSLDILPEASVTIESEQHDGGSVQDVSPTTPTDAVSRAAAIAPESGNSSELDRRAERKRLRDAYKAECKRAGEHVTDEMIAKAAMSRWTSRSNLQKWLACDPKYDGIADTAIRNVFQKKPHLPQSRVTNTKA